MYKLFLVEHTLGIFIGVAEDMRVARKAWGDRAKITELTDRAAVDAAKEKAKQVFIAD